LLAVAALALVVALFFLPETAGKQLGRLSTVADHRNIAPQIQRRRSSAHIDTTLARDAYTSTWDGLMEMNMAATKNHRPGSPQGRRYGAAAGKRVGAMRRRKRTLRRGKRPRRVTSRKQAIAIGLSEARKKGAKVPARRGVAKRKRTGRKSRA
jgi:hypothetical protein